MFSEADEPEYLRRRLMFWKGIIGGEHGAVTKAPRPAVVLASADDAPGAEATKALAHATIHPAVTGAATAERKLFVTAHRPVSGCIAPPTGELHRGELEG